MTRSPTLRAVVIVGPTAVGKSALALELASVIDGEIVSADSRQVFRYLDIGTAKPTMDERARVPHHLLDVADPDEPFDVARYRRLALDAIAEITARSRPVVVCGGTGLYIRALLHGLFAGPAAVPGLRTALYELERQRGAGTLHRRLAELDPVAASRLHPRDLVRIVRALEVREITGRPISAWQGEHAFSDRKVEALLLGCHRPRTELAGVIMARCRAMLDGGLLEEIQALARRGYCDELPALQSVGYREMRTYLRGEVTYEDALDAFARATRRLAKRQRTWFRAESAVEWFHPARERGALLARAVDWLEHPGRSAATANARSVR